ncbi:MAG: hypothetical protein GY928_16415 [Colwellia sp.]|nr:hypothetical protein [Colwellia sp.]
MPLKGRAKVQKKLSELGKESNNKLRSVYFTGLDSIVKGTPVETGRAKSNWFLTTGSPSSATTTIIGDDDVNLPKVVVGKKIYLTNNLPYISTLEYGGYPDPVKKGTWNKKTNSYEVRTTGGYSDQLFPMGTPKGWVRATMIRMLNMIRTNN